MEYEKDILVAEPSQSPKSECKLIDELREPAQLPGRNCKVHLPFVIKLESDKPITANPKIYNSNEF